MSAHALAAAALSLRADELAAQAARALDERSLPCLLLRGPVIARWLYDDPRERRYTDADLLVPAERGEEAAAALRALGFEEVLGEAAASEQTAHARTFAAAGGGWIDLHRTLSGLGADPARVWDALGRDREELALAGAPVGIPGPAARALIVATHAAQHGPQGTVQDEDVARAVARVERAVWAEAAALAEELDALAAFAAGVRRAPGGAALLDELGVSAPLTRDLAVRAQGDVPLIRGLAALEEERGAAGKARLIARELWPTPAFMRQWSPLARRGSLGLAAAYAARPFWLARHVVPALRAHRAARRSEGAAP